MSEQLYIWNEFFVDDLKRAQRIDLYLSHRFPERSRSRIQEEIKRGWIHKNGAVVTKNEKLHVDDHVCIYTPYKSKLAWLPNPDIELDIIYEDEHVILLNKKAGVQVHPATGNYDNTLVNGLVAYLKSKDEQVFLVHRLDKFTSGLILFAKTEEDRDKLNELFQNKEAKRSYRAICWGQMQDSILEGPIGRSSSNPKRFKVLPLNEGGKSARTLFENIHNYPFHSEMKCNLESGRTHQIRVHASDAGHPLVGDWEYGGNKLLRGVRDVNYISLMDDLIALFKGQALHAETLIFPHPEEGEVMHFSVDPPENYLQALEILEKTSELLNRDDKEVS